MAMSKILAEYRAKQIWGAQVEEVLLVEGFWSVLLLSEVAYLHKFDGNGRVICHWDCANLRFNYVCEYMKTKKRPVEPKDLLVPPETQEQKHMNGQTPEKLLEPSNLNFEDMPDEQLALLQQQATLALETRKQKAKAIHIERIKADMVAHGLTYRDFMTPSGLSGTGRSSRSSGSRGPTKFGIDKMLPALGAILKDGPKEQEVLRTRMKAEFGLPLDVIGMILRWGYLMKDDNGAYALTPKGVEAIKGMPPASLPIQVTNNGTGVETS